jgi:hypothetical protein
MRLTMSQRRAVAGATAAGYRRASKKEKGNILSQFVELTKYSRQYGARLLRQHGKKVWLRQTTIVGDVRKKEKRTRLRIYDDEVLEALKKIWVILDCICGKRLHAALPEVVPILKRHLEIQIGLQTQAKLLKISASTIDRLLAPERKKQALKGRSGTKPGTLLKHQIPVRTFSEWNEAQPGFAEIDLVGHDGGDGSGDFCQSLDVTDVCTAWTEVRAVRNKAQVWVFEALTHIRTKLPFQLLGIDSDNGSEFINGHLYRYCKQEHITFTRSRRYRKNDSCFVEEKNYSIVRKNVGYRRFDTPRQLQTLNQLYDYLSLYTNHFLPVQKLISKRRIGSKVKKKYDKAQTPYHRVLASPTLALANKKKLMKVHSDLNPAQLKREIVKLQEKLARLPASNQSRNARHSLALNRHLQPNSTSAGRPKRLKAAKV